MDGSTGRLARKQVPAPVPERDGGAPAPGRPDPPPPRAPAPHRCLPSRDAGRTQGDRLLAAGHRVYICILFARGACHRGADCPYLHRSPTADDEAAAAADAGADVFGRPRAGLTPDETTGTGALARVCTSLYLNWGAGGSAPPGWGHTLEAETRPYGPVTRTHVMKNGAPVAFVEFTWRASAEFAHAALARQALPGLPPGALPLTVRFALDDPNPAHAARLAFHRDVAVVDGVRAAVAAGGGGAAKRARLEGVYASQNLRAVGTDPRALERGVRVPLPPPTAAADPGAWGDFPTPGGEVEGGDNDAEEEDEDEQDADADAGLGGHPGAWTATISPPAPADAAATAWPAAAAVAADDDGGDPAAAEAAGWARGADGQWVLSDGQPAAEPAAAGGPAALGALAAYDSDGSE